MKYPTRRCAVAAVLLGAGLSTGMHAALSQPDPTSSPIAYPDGRPIKLVVPYTPGGGTDAVARVIADKISQSLGWTMVVENKPGTSGNIGMNTVAKARADGLTIGVGQTSNLAINPAWMSGMPFDPKTDLTAVALVASLPMVLVVRADSPWARLSDLVQAARAQPQRIKQALAGLGTVGHLAGELLAYQAKFEVLNIPYKGAAPAIADLMGGDTDYMFATPQAVLSMVAGGRLRALAVTSPTRLQALPNVPTIAESGYSGFEAVDWKAIVAPADTPQAIVQTINRAVQTILADAAVVDVLVREGSIPLGGSVHQATRHIASEQQKWADLITTMGIALE